MRLGYSLLMPRRVKKRTTRISSKHQVTIPASAFEAASFRPGDTLRVEARGRGQVILTRVDELADRYAGALGGGALRGQIERLRDEWR